MRRSIIRLIVTASVAFALLFAAVTFTPLVKWWSGLLGGVWDTAKGDVLVVLAADAIDGETLGVASYWRVVYTSRIFREGNFRRVVVSGAGVAPAMRDLLIFRGVPKDALVVENESTSTRENALNTARILAAEPGRKVLVTSDMHMFRARRAFRKAGVDVTGAPFPYGRKYGNSMRHRWQLFTDLVTETAKAGYYLIRGWI